MLELLRLYMGQGGIDRHGFDLSDEIILACISALERDVHKTDILISNVPLKHTLLRGGIKYVEDIPDTKSGLKSIRGIGDGTASKILAWKEANKCN